MTLALSAICGVLVGIASLCTAAYVLYKYAKLPIDKDDNNGN